MCTEEAGRSLHWGLLSLLPSVHWKPEHVAFKWEHWCSGKHHRMNLSEDCQTRDGLGEPIVETGSGPDGEGRNWGCRNEGSSRSPGWGATEAVGKDQGLQLCRGSCCLQQGTGAGRAGSCGRASLLK